MISADFVTWSVMVAFTGPKTLSSQSMQSCVLIEQRTNDSSVGNPLLTS